jgi:hypothetical protein
MVSWHTDHMLIAIYKRVSGRSEREQHSVAPLFLQRDFGGVTRYVSTWSASDEVKASIPCGSAEIVNPSLIEIPATLGQGTGQRFPAGNPRNLNQPQRWTVRLIVVV